MTSPGRRRWPLILLVGGIAGMLVLCCGGGVAIIFTSMTGGTTAAIQDLPPVYCGLEVDGITDPSATPSTTGSATASSSSGTATPTATGSQQQTAAPAEIGPLKGDQIENAAVIIAVGKSREVPPRGWIVALATAMQESSLHNLPSGDRDSVGLFQQRPSMGWGSPDELMKPEYSSAKFYEKLVQVSGWEKMRITDAAQAVQASGTPEAYQKWGSLANRLVAELEGLASLADVDDPLCVNEAGAVSLNGWTQPVFAKVGSGFRTAGRPDHEGVDLIAPRRTAIRAAGAGTVVTSKCNAGTGNCDVDGSIAVSGCGWYVEITHVAGTTTRYCHMVQRPQVSVGEKVEAGTVLGLVGSSGNSSGPHLHFEVRVSGQAIDPVPFMIEAGAPLGQQPKG